MPRHLRARQKLWPDPPRGRCRRGNDIGATSYGSIASILKHGLDKAYATEPSPDAPADPARQHPWLVATTTDKSRRPRR